MNINLSPQRRDDPLVLTKNGNVLTINGVAVDLSVIPDGATYPDARDFHDLLHGSISRSDNGEIELTLILPHGPNPAQHVAFPSPLLDIQDGDIELPVTPEPASEPQPELE